MLLFMTKRNKLWDNQSLRKCVVEWSGLQKRNTWYRYREQGLYSRHSNSIDIKLFRKNVSIHFVLICSSILKF